MSTTFTARTCSVSIECEPEKVYEFIFEASNLPRWTFFQAAARAGEEWALVTEEGPVRLRFVQRNPFGILDHHVKLESGFEVYVPLRVIANGAGSEVILTVFQTTGTSDAQFAADITQVEKDLAALKVVVEQREAWD